jgi:hypothetical protein
MRRIATILWLSAAALVLVSCQSPTAASDVVSVDDYVITSFSPDPATSEPSTGKTYRVVRGNNQPDEILEYDWKTSFTLNVLLNGRTDDTDVGFAFPIDITSATIKVQQASGGIVTPPTGAEAEHYENAVTQASGSRFGQSNDSVTMNLDVWYDLPNLRKEALVSIALAFKDKDGATFAKTASVSVAP